MPHPFIPTTQLYIPHVSHHHLKRAPRAQLMPPLAPPSTPNAKIGNPTPPPHHQTRTSVERRNRSPGKPPTPSKITPHVTYPIPSRVPRHGVTRVQVSPPFLENPPSTYSLSPAIPSHPRVARHPTQARARNLCGRVRWYTASWMSRVAARTSNYSQLAKHC